MNAAYQWKNNNQEHLNRNICIIIFTEEIVRHLSFVKKKFGSACSISEFNKQAIIPSPKCGQQKH